MSGKQLIRKFVRKSLRIRDHETVADGLNRYHMAFRKKLDKRKVTLAELESCFREAGVQEGDVLIVHAAWRGCYALQATPEDVIACLLRLIGEHGTLLMPCYGASSQEFDVKHTPSGAGVLSECFRKYPGVSRSVFPSSAMCGRGEEAEALLSGHIESRYAFDERSPYYQAAVARNARILLLGMGKRPHKISVFHCATYASRASSDFYGQVYQPKTAAVIDAQGQRRELSILERAKPYQNNKRMFRTLFRQVPHVTVVRHGLTLISFRGREAYQTAKSFCDGGGKLYLHP